MFHKYTFETLRHLSTILRNPHNSYKKLKISTIPKILKLPTSWQIKLSIYAYKLNDRKARKKGKLKLSIRKFYLKKTSVILFNPYIERLSDHSNLNLTGYTPHYNNERLDNYTLFFPEDKNIHRQCFITILHNIYNTSNSIPAFNNFSLGNFLIIGLLVFAGKQGIKILLREQKREKHFLETVINFWGGALTINLHENSKGLLKLKGFQKAIELRSSQNAFEKSPSNSNKFIHCLTPKKRTNVKIIEKENMNNSNFVNQEVYNKISRNTENRKNSSKIDPQIRFPNARIYHVTMNTRKYWRVEWISPTTKKRVYKHYGEAKYGLETSKSYAQHFYNDLLIQLSKKGVSDDSRIIQTKNQDEQNANPIKYNYLTTPSSSISNTTATSPYLSDESTPPHSLENNYFSKTLISSNTNSYNSLPENTTSSSNFNIKQEITNDFNSIKFNPISNSNSIKFNPICNSVNPNSPLRYIEENLKNKSNKKPLEGSDQEDHINSHKNNNSHNSKTSSKRNSFSKQTHSLSNQRVPGRIYLLNIRNVLCWRAEWYDHKSGKRKTRQFAETVHGTKNARLKALEVLVKSHCVPDNLLDEARSQFNYERLNTNGENQSENILPIAQDLEPSETKSEKILLKSTSNNSLAGNKVDQINEYQSQLIYGNYTQHLPQNLIIPNDFNKFIKRNNKTMSFEIYFLKNDELKMYSFPEIPYGSLAASYSAIVHAYQLSQMGHTLLKFNS